MGKSEECQEMTDMLLSALFLQHAKMILSCLFSDSLVVWPEIPRTWAPPEWDYVQDDKEAIAAVSGTTKFLHFN